MKNISQIINMPVVSYATGEKVAFVKDVIYDAEANTVIGLIVDEGGLFGPTQAIPFSRIRSIGDDAVIIPDDSVIQKVQDDETMVRSIAARDEVKGKTVMTEDGKDLGKINDVSIDEVSGNVRAYQVSGGLFADLYNGKPSVPAPEAVKVGEDVLFVPNETVELMREQVGGIKAGLQETAESVKNMGEKATQKGKELTGSASERAKEVYQSPENREKLDQVKDRTKEGYSEVKDQAGSLWEQAKEKATEVKDQASRKLEETKIKNALGKPVNRVILDKNDNAILNTGDLITHEAIDRSRQAGVLDILLTSVYGKEPELNSKDIKST